MEKKKFKFNYVDVIIIILVAAVFVFGYKFINKSSGNTSDVPDVAFTVEVKNMDFDYKNHFAEGDEIFDAVKGGPLGVVTDVEATAATELITDTASGQYHIGKYSDKETVLITIKGTPTSFGKDIMIGQQKIKIGEMVYIKKAGCVGRGYVVKMEVEEAGAND